MQLDVGDEVLDELAARVVLAADQAVDLVPLLEQQLGEVEAVLAGDSGDERAGHGRQSVRRSAVVRVTGMKILVSGGAGYIGSHTVIQLIAAGHDVVIVDNFSNAHPTVLGAAGGADRARALAVHSFDLCDYDKTEHLFAAEDFDAVIHFAGHKAVGESVEKPLDYYENNLGSTFSLVARDAAPRRRQARLLLQRHGLRRPTRPARPRTGAPSPPTPTAGPR